MKPRGNRKGAYPGSQHGGYLGSQHGETPDNGTANPHIGTKPRENPRERLHIAGFTTGSCAGGRIRPEVRWHA